MTVARCKLLVVRLPGLERFPALRRFVRDRAAMFGLALVALALAAATIGPEVAPYDPAALHVDALLVGPGSRFWLGTDELGRDLLSRVLLGARVSLSIAVGVVSLAGLAGISFGLVAGYFGGRLDAVLMRCMDAIFAFPAVLLALALVSVLGASTRNLVIAITLVYVPVFARLVRGLTQQLRSELYVEAARALGASDARIVVAHILPNISAPIIVQATVILAYAILVEAAMSFLGLGVQPPTPTWGGMLAAGKGFLEQSPWVAIVPGLAIMLTVLGFNLLGDGVSDLLDPRLSQEVGGR
ncbi:MAG: ABC transporter permease [Anaerolineales bacterium]|nr:ABC transporter permease [Anaerolineales bacterium]